jgi:ankyrin repeat protein
MHAVRSRRLEAIELLLLSKAHTNIKNKAGETALIFGLPTRNESYGVRKLDLAAHNNPLVPLLAALLKARADTNIRLRDGITPLMIAASREAEPVVKLLLAYGANVHAKTELGLTAYHVAMGEEVINMLKAARGLEKPTGPSKVEPIILNNLLFEAAERGNTDLVRKLIVEDGANPNFRTQDWRVPVLYAAIRSRSASTVETLLKLGADPNISHETLGSPIAHARSHLKPDVLPEVIKVLIAGGASPEPAK